MVMVDRLHYVIMYIYIYIHIERERETYDIILRYIYIIRTHDVPKYIIIII